MVYRYICTLLCSLCFYFSYFFISFLCVDALCIYRSSGRAQVRLGLILPKSHVETWERGAPLLSCVRGAQVKTHTLRSGSTRESHSQQWIRVKRDIRHVMGTFMLGLYPVNSSQVTHPPQICGFATDQRLLQLLFAAGGRKTSRWLYNSILCSSGITIPTHTLHRIAQQHLLTMCPAKCT